MYNLTFDLTGKGGLAPRFYRDLDNSVAQPEIRTIGEDDQMAAGLYNPWRKYGYMSPATAVTDPLSFGSVGYIRSIAYNPQSLLVFMANNGTDLYSVSALEATSIGSIRTVAGATMMDLEIYQVNGVLKYFYAYAKAGGGNIGIWDGSVTYNDTWLSGTVAGAFNTGATNEVFMRLADNGFMYVFDGAAVHKIDGNTTGGANGTATANVLTFPINFYITDALDYRGNIYIATIKNVEAREVSTNSTANYRRANSYCGIYVWDRLSTQVRTRDFIEIPGVRKINKLYMSPSGSLRAITLSSAGYTQIREYNGTSFQVIEELDSVSRPLWWDSVSIGGGMTYWLGGDGYIYAHGSYSFRDKEGIFKLYQVSSSSTFYPGVCLFGLEVPFSSNASTANDQQSLFTSYNATANASGVGVVARYYINGSGSINSINQNGGVGNVFTLSKILPSLSTIKHGMLYMLPNSALNSSLTTVAGTIAFYKNGETTAFSTKNITLDDIRKGYMTIELNKEYVNALQIGITFATGAIGTSTFCPSLLTLTAVPTSTVK